MKKSELEKKVKELEGLLANAYSHRYQITERGDPNHNHSWDDYELSSSSGIAFCDWRCECGFVVSQTLGERIPPEKIPKDKSAWKEE